MVFFLCCALAKDCSYSISVLNRVLVTIVKMAAKRGRHLVANPDTLTVRSGSGSTNNYLLFIITVAMGSEAYSIDFGFFFASMLCMCACVQ